MRLFSQLEEWDTTCSRVFLGSYPTLQPYSMINDKPVCLGCSSSCLQMAPKSLPKFESRTGISCACASVAGFCLYESRVDSKLEILESRIREKMCQLMLQAYLRQEEEFKKRFSREIESRIVVHSKNVFDFEDPGNKKKALSVIPIKELERRAKGYFSIFFAQIFRS